MFNRRKRLCDDFQFNTRALQILLVLYIFLYVFIYWNDLLVITTIIAKWIKFIIFYYYNY